MNKFKIGLIAGLALIFTAGLLSPAFIVKIDKGYEGAKINTLGTSQGDITPMGTGWHTFNCIKYDIITNPTFVQEYVWTASKDEGSPNDESIDFQSSNSLQFTANVGIKFVVRHGVTGKLYTEYHKEMADMIDTNLRNSVRDAFVAAGSTRDAEKIYGSGKNEFVADVEARVRAQWNDYLDIKKVYLVGSLVPPQQIRAAINAKIQAKQKAQQRQNEVAESRAKADKQIAEARGVAESRKLAADAEAYEVTAKSTAQADAIRRINEQLAKSPRYIEYVKAQKWDGALPTYMAGAAPMPMMDIKQ